MADILLATSYYLRYDPKQQRLLKPYPPLGTLYAAAVLRRAGWSVALFDAMFAPGEAAFEAALEAHKPAIVALYEDSFNWLNKMCLARMRQAAFTMADMARRRGARIIAAGPDASDVPEQYLEHTDQVILGEGEATLEALCRFHAVARHAPSEPGGASMPDPSVRSAGSGWVEPATDAGSDRVIPGAASGMSREAAGLLAIPGLALRGPDGGVVKTAPRSLLTDLDALPRAAWDLVDIEAYRQTWRRRHGYFSLNQITTRGCPFRCNWCAKPVYGDAYHSRSPEHLVDELRWVKAHLKPDHLWYADDILGLKKSWLLRFADLAGQADVAIPFTCQTRVDLMTEANVAALRRAGCREAWLGAESGAQTVLDAMEKGITVDQTRAAADRLKRAGIRVAFFIQLGYPGERWPEIEATRALISTCLPDEIGISVAYPLPGTRFYERVAGSVGDKTRWEHSGDLDPLFPGAWPRDFYQRLHEMLHGEFQSRHGFRALQRLLSEPAQSSREDVRRVAKLPINLGRFALRRVQVEVGRRTTTPRSAVDPVRS